MQASVFQILWINQNLTLFLTVETNSHKERAEKGGFLHAGRLKQQTMFDPGRRLRLLLQSCSITMLTEQVCRCNKRGDYS